MDQEKALRGYNTGVRKQVATYLTLPQVDALKAMAAQRGISIAEFLRQMVDDAIRQNAEETTVQ